MIVNANYIVDYDKNTITYHDNDLILSFSDEDAHEFLDWYAEDSLEDSLDEISYFKEIENYKEKIDFLVSYLGTSDTSNLEESFVGYILNEYKKKIEAIV